MELLISFFKKPFIKRVFCLILVALVLYLVKDQITLFILTFILIYLIDTFQKYVSRRMDGIIKLNRIVIIIFTYILFTGFLFLIIYKFVPELIKEITEIIKTVTSYIAAIDSNVKTNNIILDYTYGYIKQFDLQSYIKNSAAFILSIISSIGNISINIFLAIILSLFFLLEKDKIIKFYEGFKNSKVSFLYEELNYFGRKFSNSFGKVIQIQILISFINAVLSFIALAVLQFPNTFGLCIMIFILGLVPVAGVIISFIPLSIIAYSIGGFNYIIYILIIIVVLHSLEAYVLNPKLMSQKTKLPVFITFLVLIISERTFGAWGLIVGIPIMIFLLDVLEIKTE